ncbi:RNA-binding, RBD [Glarea lozoyensis ATCC 20868]|uniref:RNA-binding, RBD n=1 Tax=Glarea lozoyensis (strain ATCC 20868 / MF5171) TaxID=1116229 RepID=S3D1I1_GLAL2|nr:RNA-binding, RBD [Glarea lozoyensis ATCC 20868]EPE31024.1 RNA-binding, RBD [Glarea lozoyensis ATCC 20868]
MAPFNQPDIFGGDSGSGSKNQYTMISGDKQDAMDADIAQKLLGLVIARQEEDQLQASSSSKNYPDLSPTTTDGTSSQSNLDTPDSTQSRARGNDTASQSVGSLKGSVSLDINLEPGFANTSAALPTLQKGTANRSASEESPLNKAGQSSVHNTTAMPSRSSFMPPAQSFGTFGGIADSIYNDLNGAGTSASYVPQNSGMMPPVRTSAMFGNVEDSNYNRVSNVVQGASDPFAGLGTQTLRAVSDPTLLQQDGAHTAAGQNISQADHDIYGMFGGWRSTKNTVGQKNIGAVGDGRASAADVVKSHGASEPLSLHANEFIAQPRVVDGSYPATEVASKNTEHGSQEPQVQLPQFQVPLRPLLFPGMGGYGSSMGDTRNFQRFGGMGSPTPVNPVGPYRPPQTYQTSSPADGTRFRGLSIPSSMQGGLFRSPISPNHLRAQSHPSSALQAFGERAMVNAVVEPNLNPSTKMLALQQRLAAGVGSPIATDLANQPYHGSHHSQSMQLPMENLRNEFNCALWVTNIPVAATSSDIFDVIKCGAVASLHVSPPDVDHPFKAAKLIFKEPLSAAAFLAQSQLYGIRIRDQYIRVIYNRHGSLRWAGNQTRVLRITGPEHLMYIEYWNTLFSRICVYEFDICEEIPCAEPGRKTMEFHFERIDGQSQMCLKAVFQVPTHTDIQAGYGRDRCEPKVPGLLSPF